MGAHYALDSLGDDRLYLSNAAGLRVEKTAN